MVRRATSALALGCLGLLLSACSDSLQGTIAPNALPETEITILPPAPDAAGFHVTFFWSGSDPDGVVEAYEWRISANGPDGIVDRADTLGLPWHRTTATDSTFLVSADLDSFSSDVGDTNQGAGSYRFWQTHTFFVRAVDDRGGADETPAHASFTSTTLSPRVTITQPIPVSGTSCLQSARTLSFRWSYVDPDDSESGPDAIRYLMVDLEELPPEIIGPVDLGDDQCLDQKTIRETDLIARIPESFWSRWISADAPEDSAWTVTFPRYDPGQRLIFAVQGRDRAGAVTPTFDWGVNLRHLRVGASHAPALTVQERYLGTFYATGTTRVSSAEVVATQPVAFRWSAEASTYGGIVQAYRYGWNLTDPSDENDPGWAVPWSAEWDHAPERTFADGFQTFVIRVRDNSGGISQATYQIRVIPIPRRENQRTLLLIDDWGWSNTFNELVLQEKWLARWRSFLELRLDGWNPNADILRVNRQPQDCDFATISQYKGLIWFLNGKTNSKLRDSFLAGEGTFNWMQLYQEKVGNILMTGPQAMHSAFGNYSSEYPIIISERSSTARSWPWEMWCLEAVDLIRPNPGSIPCEDSGIQRTETCDRPIRLQVPPELYEAYPSAEASLGDLLPDAVRTENSPLHKLRFEEFYNINVSCRGVQLNLRPCQQAMFRAVAYRDDSDPETGEPYMEDPARQCQPVGRPRSPLTGVPMGLVVTAHSDTKPVVGSEDFLWGFHPLAWDYDDTKAALIWILRERWQLPVLFD